MTAPSDAPVPVRLDTVVLDCPDPAALARFYAALLGRQVDPGGDATWQSLTGDGSGPSLAFQRAERYVAPSWPDGVPQQMHLDLTVTDMAAAHARAVQLGAVPLDPQRAPTGDESRGFRVYADPAGHPFCLCRCARRFRGPGTGDEGVRRRRAAGTPPARRLARTSAGPRSPGRLP